MRFFIPLIIAAAVCACAQAPIASNESLVVPLPAQQYQSLIEQNTVKADRYSGFHQTFQADVTILSTEVQTALLKQRGAFLQWDNKQFQTERDKVMQENAAYAKFFLRFYSPETDYDDFHKGKSIWRIYLEYSGSRFEGKVRKLNEKFIEVQNMFPHMNRFSSAYEITFNVPMTTIETGPSKVVITSGLGTAEFKFPATR